MDAPPFCRIKRAPFCQHADTAMLSIKKTLRSINLKSKDLFCQIRPDPIFILGHHKSGTTVIARLIAASLGETYSHDMFYKRGWPDTDQLISGRLSLEQVIARGRSEFSCGVIKEPSLSFILPELKDKFPMARFVFVLRDPRSTIRSVLNRLGIPGTVVDVDERKYPALENSELWSKLFKTCPPIISGNTPIEILSSRWKTLARTYLSNADLIHPIYYEAFEADKVKRIEDIIHKMNLTPINPISHKVDIQYQPKGNRSVQFTDFFGDVNLKKIEEICRSEMLQLGYS